MRRSISGRGPQIRSIGISRHGAPAHQLLPFLGANPRHHRFALLSLRLVPWQKDDAGRKTAGLGQLHVKLVERDACEKFVRQRGKNAGPITGVRLTTASTAMIHAAKNVARIADDLMTALALDVRHETDAATVVLVLGAIQPRSPGLPAGGIRLTR